MIPLLLLYKIIELFLIMLLGFILVKSKLIKAEDSLLLSKLSLYLFMPAVIINSFNIMLTDEIMSGLALAFLAAIAIHIVLLPVGRIYRKLSGATSAEQASVVYSNAGNLIIPIVSYVLGDEWVVYSLAFLSVQIFFLWTHGIRLFNKSEKLDIKKILLNINIIAIVIGFIMMLSGLRLPKIIGAITSSLGSMLGPVGMIIAGMLASRIDFKKVMKSGRIYIVTAMRMIVCPIIMLLLLKLGFGWTGIESADSILLISFLASITPAASTVMQFAQISNSDADFAAAINIVTTIVCIITMPVFVALFQIL